MPRPTKPKSEPMPAAAKTDAGTALNKAKAAFDEYRKKRSGTVSDPGRERHAEKEHVPPPAGPFPMFPVPGWGAPSQFAPGTPWSGAPWPGAGAGPMSGPAAAMPFAESVGQMLRMGVAFATAAFAGGLQVMEGFAGTGFGPAHGPMPGHHGHPGCGCACGEDCGCCCESDCGCSCQCCCDEADCCRVGVHNCGCYC